MDGYCDEDDDVFQGFLKSIDLTNEVKAWQHIEKVAKEALALSLKL